MPRTQKTPDERLRELDAKIEKQKAEIKKIEEQKKILEKQKKTAERKADAHRKIEVGATVESICHIPIEKEDLPKLVSYLKAQEAKGFYFSTAMGYDHEEVKDGNNTMVVYRRGVTDEE